MLMRNRYRAALLMIFSPAAALALGLGDIHLKSALNAPLDADIELIGASSDDVSTVKATLASRDAFGHYGLEYPSFLGTVTFAPELTADGHAVIHVRSSDPVHEPFRNLLVEINLPRGHWVREYTVLLDPPVSGADTAAASAATARRLEVPREPASSIIQRRSVGCGCRGTDGAPHSDAGRY